MAIDVEKLKRTRPPKGMPFKIRKLGHVVLQVSNLERSLDFYTQILGFKVSDVYPHDMMPGGMIFLRCNGDHHSLALVGAGKGHAENVELHHMAFEVSTLDEVPEFALSGASKRFGKRAQPRAPEPSRSCANLRAIRFCAMANRALAGSNRRSFLCPAPTRAV